MEAPKATTDQGFSMPHDGYACVFDFINKPMIKKPARPMGSDCKSGRARAVPKVGVIRMFYCERRSSAQDSIGTYPRENS
jgi:hypothetical protein